VNSYYFKKIQGYAIVEFIVVLPVLLLLLLSTAEVGRALYQYNILTQSARNSVRYYAQNVYLGSSRIPNPVSEENAKKLAIYGSVRNTNSLIADSTVSDVTTILAENVDNSGNDYVTVTINYKFILLSGDPLGAVLQLFGGTTFSPMFNISATMRVI